MRVPFLGGPYDGQAWDEAEVDRLIFFAAAVRPPHRFAYLPDPADWPAVRAGRMGVHGSRAQHCYELVDAPGGAKLRHFPAGDKPTA